MAMDIRHILAPTDFSDYSKKALSDALELARTFGAKLSLLHVVEPSPYLGKFTPPATGEVLLGDLERQTSAALARMLGDLVQQAWAALARMLQEAQQATMEVTRAVVMGSPSLKIVETAEAEHVDLIVMATHGRTGLSHLLIGSVAERVVRTAPCPVLTIRPAAEKA
jgi:universal stress protein A